MNALAFTFGSHPELGAYARMFPGKYAHRTIAAASATTCRRKRRAAFALMIVDVAKG